MKIPPTALVVKRLPLGLEILIVFGALGAVYYFYSSMMLFYNMSILSRIIPSEAAIQMTMVGILWLLASLLFTAVSWGLWNLKEWARKILMIIAVVAVIGAFLEIVPGLLAIAYDIIILWYISRPHVKALFEVGRASGMKTSIPAISLARRVCPSCGKKGKPGATFCVKCGSELKAPEA